MAKFSQAFLQSMTQPAYQEGLFTAARSLGGLPGRIREEQRNQAEIQEFRGMTPDQQFDFLELKAKTPQEILQVQGMRTEAAQTKIRAEEAKAKAKREVANAEWQTYTRNKTLEEDRNNQLVNSASLSAVDSGDINGYIDQLSPEIPDFLKERIRQEAVAVQKSKEAAGQIATEKTLPQEYIDALQNNPKLVDSAEAQEQLRLYNNPKNVGDQKRAAFVFRDLVDAEDKSTRALYNSDTYAKDRAGDALRYLQSMESEVYFFESEDLPRVVQGLEGDDLSDFKTKLELEYRKNPSANPEDAAQKALEQMQIEPAGAKLASDRRAERTKLEEKREAAIQELMDKGMDRVEAEIELNRQGEQKLQAKQQETTAGIEAVRAAAKERKYGPSLRG